MKKVLIILLTILMLFSLVQGTLRENVVKAGNPPIWSMFRYNAQHTGQCPYDTSSNNGTPKWQYKTSSLVFSSPAIASDGTIYVGSYDHYLYAINPDGTPKWQYKTGSLVFSSPAIASDGTIYVGSYDHYLYAINPDGTPKWQYKTGSGVVSSPAIASDGTIYVGSYDHYLYAINPNGTLKWQYKTGSYIRSSPAIASDGTIYVGSNDGHLYAINPNGTPKWQYQTGSGVVSSPTIASDGTIYVGAGDGFLNAINPDDGTLKWQYQTGSYIRSSPTIASDGTIYVGSGDSFLYAIGTYTITASAGSNGSISPSGEVTVNSGSDQTFTIKANPGFMISRILVDGSSARITNPITMKYTFTNVTSDHTISAEFVLIPDTTPPTISNISGINLSASSPEIKTNKDTFTFTVKTHDKSGIARMVVKVNGVVQIDKDNLDPTIHLSDGVNTVEVIVYDRSGNYTSKSFKVISDTKPPVINLTLPKTVTSPDLTIKGKAYDQTSGTKSVTVNGKPIAVTLSGYFKTTLTLSPGVNNITIEAEDKLGNISTKTFKVTYAESSSASSSIMIILKIGSPYINVNGVSKKIDAQNSAPIIENSRTFLPIRTLIESLGGTVEWDVKERKVTINLNGHSIILWIGKTTALVDGNKTKLDVAPFILNGRTYLPLRFIAEHLNAAIDWQSSTQTITIYYWP